MELARHVDLTLGGLPDCICYYFVQSSNLSSLTRIVYSINNKGLPRWIQKRWPFLGGKKWTPMAGNSNSECVNLLLSNCKIWSWAQIKQNFISYQIAKTNFYYMRPPKASRDQKRSKKLNFPPWGSTFLAISGNENGSLF